MRQFDYISKLKSKIIHNKYILIAVSLLLPLVTPLVMPASTASASETFNEYPLSSSYSVGAEATTANGALWYRENVNGGVSNDYIGEMTTSGATTDYNISTPSGYQRMSISNMATGPDGNVWFDGCAENTTPTYSWATEAGYLNTSTGAVTFYPNTYLGGGGCTNGASPGAIATGPDGNVWYEVNGSGSTNYLFSVNPSTGATTTAWYDNAPAQSWITYGRGMATGSDGRLWVTDTHNNRVEAFTVSSGTATAESTYTVPTTNSEPTGLIAGPNGNLWFVEANNNTVNEVTTSGSFSQFTPASGVTPRSLATGPDGAVWFADDGSSTGEIGRITTSGSITEYTVPGTNVSAGDLTVGPDNAMWFDYAAGSGSSETWGLGRLGY